MTKISDDPYPHYYRHTAVSRVRTTLSGMTSIGWYLVPQPDAPPQACDYAWRSGGNSLVYDHERELIKDRYERVYP